MKRKDKMMFAMLCAVLAPFTFLVVMVAPSCPVIWLLLVGIGALMFKPMPPKRKFQGLGTLI